jgi:hypothetical protein
MTVSNEDIMEKLEKIESMLQTVAGEEKKIEAEEEKELKELDESGIKLEYHNPEDWRKYIWENCEHKEERSEGDEVDFWCKKQDAPCRFEGCPLNVRGEE